MGDYSFTVQLLHSLGLPNALASADMSWKEWSAYFSCSLSIKDRMVLLVSYWAIAFLKEWDFACIVSCHATPSELVYWQALIESVVKFNFNSAFSFHTGRTTSGVVGRNSSGLIMAACSVSHTHVADACVAEALACKQTVVCTRFGFFIGHHRW
ncbi:hypothetical protein V6N13_130557 [Hibiscus sabdariffa]